MSPCQHEQLMHFLLFVTDQTQLFALNAIIIHETCRSVNFLFAYLYPHKPHHHQDLFIKRAFTDCA